MKIIEAGNTDTFKCPTCGSKVLVNTGYCLSCKKKVKVPDDKKPAEKKDDKKDDKKKESVILDIQEEISFISEDHRVTLEKGDRIEVVNESKLNEDILGVIHDRKGRDVTEVIDDAVAEISDMFEEWRDASFRNWGSEAERDYGSLKKMSEVAIGEIQMYLIKEFNEVFGMKDAKRKLALK